MNELIKIDDPDTKWHETVPKEVNFIGRKGLKIVGGFILIFALWGFLFPITSAVIVAGKVVSDGQNKLIQHPIGGRVTKIFIKDGQQVKAGTPLLKLDPVKDQAELKKLEVRLLTQNVIQARLQAQMADKDTIAFPKDVVDQSLRITSAEDTPTDISQNAVIKGIISDQKAEFRASRTRIKKQLATLQEQIKSIEQEMIGRKDVMKSLQKRIKTFRRQVKKLKPAVKKGFVSQSRLEEVNDDLLELEGEYSNTKAELQSGQFRMAEIKERINETKAQNYELIAEKLGKARSQVGELKNEIRAARWAYENSVIKSPVSGVLTNLIANTVGGTIPANEVIAQIVPENANLLFEASVNPQDIDSVNIGNQAEVSINAFNQRLVDNLKAEVTYVSADSQIDTNTGEAFFTVRLKLLGINNPTKNKVRAGMQGEVYIITGSRVFFSYMMKPISDSFRRAFRER